MSNEQSTLEPEAVLRRALEAGGQRYTEQRAAVFRFLRGTLTHPTADDVFVNVRRNIPDISLATVYKSLETLVGVGLAVKLATGDGSARYDGRTEPHHHARCTLCGTILDVPGHAPAAPLPGALEAVDGFQVQGYRLELLGRCAACREA